MAETLIQILIAVSIVAVIVLIVALAYLILILRRIDNAAGIMDNRVKEINSYIASLENTINVYAAAVKSFLAALGVKLIKEKMDDVGKSKPEGDKDGE